MPEPQPSQPFAATPSVRRTIGPWRLLGTLGSGGMGVVYRAVHVETGLQCALKTVRSTAPGLFDAIRRETRVLRRLRHPGVVRVIDDGVDEGVPWYAMEELAGPTLRTWMAYGRDSAEGVEPTLTIPPDLDVAVVAPSEGPSVEPAGLPVGRLPDVLRLLRRLCDALAFLHGEGVVHRDLKPENVFLRDDGEPVLVDFGLVARFGGADLREDLPDGTHREVGTLAYMAPEQIRGELVDARADLYAFGCILYELLTGRPPFVGSRARVIWQHLQASALPVSTFAPHLPAHFDALCARLLAKMPGDRIGYAEDVAAALDALGAPPAPTPTTRARAYLYRPTLVGRASDLERVADRLPAPGSPGTVVLIGGESGVGKTRLALELARLAGEKRIRVIRSECPPVRQPGPGTDVLGAGPLQPLRPALQAIADHCRGADADEIAEILGPRGPLVAEHEPALLPYVAGMAPVEPLAQVAAARLRLVRWMGETLSAFAKRRPLLLIIDDLHWADDVTLAFLDGVAQGTVPLDGISVVGTWRTEQAAALASLPERPAVLAHRLDALAPTDVRALVAEMLAFDDPPAAVVDALVHLSGGNPFYVGEYLHVAVARGVLMRADGRWRVGAIDPLPSLPTTLPDLLDARYDALDADARRLLDAASVVVGDVSADVMGEVAELGVDALLDATRVLLVRKILEEADPGRYRLAHGRIREGAYARLTPESRRGAHRRAAIALEARHSEKWVDLAHHWQQAGEELRAWPWLCEAGQSAWRAGAPREARGLLDEAFAIAARHGLDGGGVDRGALDVTYAQVLHALGEIDGAIEAARRALKRLGHPVPSTPTGWVLRAAWEIFGQVLGIRRAPASDPAIQRQFLLAMRAANVIERSSLVSAQPLVQIAAGVTAMGFADRAGPTLPVVHGYTGPAATCGLLGLETAYRRLLARGREAALRSGADLQLVALSETFVCGCRGHWERAAQAAAEGIEAARRVGDDYALTQIEMAHVVALLGRGDLNGTLALGHRVADQARRGGYGVEEMYGRLAVVGALVDQGRLGEASEALDPVDRLRSEVKQEAATTTALATRALILARTHGSEARAVLADVRRRLETERTANPSYIVAFRRTLEAALTLGDLDTARSALKGLRRQARLQPPGRSGAKRFEAEIRRQEGRPDRAIALLRQAQAAAVALSQPFDEAWASWDLANLVEPPQQASLRERARALFASLGVMAPPGPSA